MCALPNTNQKVAHLLMFIFIDHHDKKLPAICDGLLSSALYLEKYTLTILPFDQTNIFLSQNLAIIADVVQCDSLLSAKLLLLWYDLRFFENLAMI